MTFASMNIITIETVTNDELKLASQCMKLKLPLILIKPNLFYSTLHIKPLINPIHLSI